MSDFRLSPVRPGAVPLLTDDEAAPPRGVPGGKKLAEELDGMLERINELSSALFAEGRRALLFVLQARDTGGKDGTIRHVFGAINPQSLLVTPFGVPAGDELKHDFLWRVHRAVPPFGRVGVFNRSHYEDVLVARVRGLVPREVWAARYEQINDFERLLTRNGVTLVKLFLHLSRDEQKRRLLKRLEQPHKRWKFDPADLDARDQWDEYTEAYRDVLSLCSTPEAPWYVVPADDKKVRDLLVARVALETLERMDPKYPEAEPNLKEFEKRLR